MVLNKWFIALLQLAVALVTGLQVMRVDGISVTEGWQFGGLAVAQVGVVALPLLKGGWHAALKVIVALAGAGITAIIPLVTNTWTVDSTIIVILAVLNAAAVQFGIDARVDGVKEALADPNVANSKVFTIEPVVAQIAAKTVRAVDVTEKGLPPDFVR